MLLTELKEHSFEKEKEGDNIIKIYRNNFSYSYDKKQTVLNSTLEPLNGKYYLIDEEEINYYKNGKRHREDNFPAIIFKNGTVFYYVNGKVHRIDGPAWIYSDGNYIWYINGHLISKKEMNKFLKENNIPLDWNTWTESDKFLFALHWSDYGLYGE